MKRALALALTAMMTLSAVEVFVLEPNEPITTEEEFQLLRKHQKFSQIIKFHKYYLFFNIRTGLIS